MKINFHYILIFIISAAFMSCEKDNYEEPSSLLSGRLVYQGNPLYLEFNRVSYDLYQDDFGKIGPLGSTFTSEGAFSHLLFNGTYKMVVPEGQGPFLWENLAETGQDTLIINLNGNVNMDIEVIPYWMINNTNFSASANSVTGTFALQQIVTDAKAKNIENVTIYISKTQFANSQTNVVINSVEGSAITDPSNISLNVTVPNLVPAQNYVFASIGVKFEGVDDMLFSPTQKLTIN
jgi:hypothetical protein